MAEQQKGLLELIGYSIMLETKGKPKLTHRQLADKFCEKLTVARNIVDHPWSDEEHKIICDEIKKTAQILQKTTGTNYSNLDRVAEILYYDTVELFEQQSTSHQPLPDTLLLKKEERSNLSKEAKTVINMILHTPGEILRHIFPVRKRDPDKYLDMTKLRQALWEKGWEHKEIDSVFEEIKRYIKTF